jgi:hypothetical protein
MSTVMWSPLHDPQRATRGPYPKRQAATADSAAERFGLPARDGRAMERGEEASEGPDEGDTKDLNSVGAEGVEPPTSAL